jgi:hypothetical protein
LLLLTDLWHQSVFGGARPARGLKLDVLQLKLMNKPAIHVSEADGANDFPSRVARVRGRRRSVIERDAQAVAVLLGDE